MGPITHLVRLPEFEGEPYALHPVSAHVAKLGAFSNWNPDPQGSGCVFNLEASCEAAIGEAVERYSGNYPHPPAKWATTEKLDSEGSRYIDPASLVAISESQRVLSTGLVPHSPKLNYAWLNGYDLRDGSLTLVPRDAASLHFEAGSLSSLISRLPGIAAGDTLESAVAAGTLELIERDATARWWLTRQPCDEISQDWVTSLPLDGISPRLSIRLFSLHSIIPSVHVVCALLYDSEVDVWLAGFAARTNVRIAALKAIGETFQLRRIAHGIINPDSWTWKRSEFDDSQVFPLVPYRADRAYMDSLPPHKMTQLIHNLQYALDPRSQEPFLSAIENSIAHRNITPSETNLPFLPLSEPDVLNPVPGSIAYVDLTTTDAARLGYSVVRVIAPDLLINAPEAHHPWRDVKRLYGVEYSAIPPMPHA